MSLSHGHFLFHSIGYCTFHVTPMATNELVSAQQQCNNETERKDDSKKSNVYRNGRGQCNLGEPACGKTSGPYKMGGLLWIRPLHNVDFVSNAIKQLDDAGTNNSINPLEGLPVHPLHTAKTLHGLLVLASKELQDVPLYHLLPSLCSSVNSSTIPLTTFGA